MVTKTTKDGTPAKPTTRKAPAKRAARPARRPGSFETALAALGRKADEASGKLAELTDEGAKAANRQLAKASKATSVQVEKLQKGWQKMDATRRAQVVAGAFAALAAAVVPIVVHRRRKGQRRASADEKSAKG